MREMGRTRASKIETIDLGFVDDSFASSLTGSFLLFDSATLAGLGATPVIFARRDLAVPLTVAADGVVSSPTKYE